MQERSCPYCKKDILLQAEVCSHCNRAIPPLPNYPSASPKWFMVLWGFFVILIVALLVSMFGAR